MKGDPQYVKAFMVGYNNGANEYIPSSNLSDAVEAGRYWRGKNYPLPQAIRKSRGYTWVIDRTVLKIDGLAVKEV